MGLKCSRSDVPGRRNTSSPPRGREINTAVSRETASFADAKCGEHAIQNVLRVDLPRNARKRARGQTHIFGRKLRIGERAQRASQMVLRFTKQDLACRDARGRREIPTRSSSEDYTCCHMVEHRRRSVCQVSIR